MTVPSRRYLLIAVAISLVATLIVLARVAQAGALPQMNVFHQVSTQDGA